MRLIQNHCISFWQYRMRINNLYSKEGVISYDNICCLRLSFGKGCKTFVAIRTLICSHAFTA